MIGRHLRADVSQLIVLLVINAVIGFSGGIDWRAHLGGALTGALIAAMYVQDQKGTSRVLQSVGTSGVAIGLLVLIFLRCQQLIA